MKALIYNGGEDYTMPEDLQRVWITIGPFSLWVYRLPGADGISVSLHPKGRETDIKQDLGSIMSYYSDVS